MPPLLHLPAHPFTSLPSHPSLDSARSRPDLREFLHAALEEAYTFLGTTIPETFTREPRPRPSPPSAAKIQLYTRAVREDTDLGIDDGYWVCRRSVHRDAPEPGTASWEEFRTGLRVNHSENEMAYTPTVTDVQRLLEWPVEAEIEDGWTDVDAHVNMITHTFQPTTLISRRCFLTLVISAHLPAKNGFVTVQIPLTHKPANSIPAELREKITKSVPRRTVFAAYASVERVLVTGDGKIEWTMATTSDAGGLIPQSVQRSWTLGGVPKAVVADVGLFIGWTERNRKK